VRDITFPAEWGTKTEGRRLDRPILKVRQRPDGATPRTAMNLELEQLVMAYNDAVERYNLARLEYAMSFEKMIVPPVANAMPIAEIDRAERHRPAALSVQAVRDFFEGIFDGVIVADTLSDSYDCLHGASLEMTRRFFQVSLTRMGISCRGMLD
jgi:hypothetical protein